MHLNKAIPLCHLWRDAKGEKLNSSCSSRPGIAFRLQGKQVIVTGGVWIGHDGIPCKSFLMETNTCHPPSPNASESYTTIHKTLMPIHSLCVVFPSAMKCIYEVFPLPLYQRVGRPPSPLRVKLILFQLVFYIAPDHNRSHLRLILTQNWSIPCSFIKQN